MIKKLRQTIRENFTEIWLGVLLFLAVPAVAALYLDYRAFLAVSFSFQTIILILSVYKGNK